jgi:hypothetical protein
VIIRETHQAAEFAGMPSFPASKSQEFRAYAKDSLLRDVETDDLSAEEGDDESVVVDDEDLEGMHPVDPGMEDAADSDEDDTESY